MSNRQEITFKITRVNIFKLPSKEEERLQVFKTNTELISNTVLTSLLTEIKSPEISEKISKTNAVTKEIGKIKGYIDKVRKQYSELYNELIESTTFQEYPPIADMYKTLLDEMSKIESWKDIEGKIIPKLGNSETYTVNLPREKNGDLHRLFLIFSGDTTTGFKPWKGSANPKITYGPALAEILESLKPSNLEIAYNTIYDIIVSGNINNYTSKPVRLNIKEDIEKPKKLNKFDGVNSLRLNIPFGWNNFSKKRYQNLNVHGKTLFRTILALPSGIPKEPSNETKTKSFSKLAQENQQKNLKEKFEKYEGEPTYEKFIQFLGTRKKVTPYTWNAFATTAYKNLNENAQRIFRKHWKHFENNSNGTIPGLNSTFMNSAVSANTRVLLKSRIEKSNNWKSLNKNLNINPLFNSISTPDDFNDFLISLGNNIRIKRNMSDFNKHYKQEVINFLKLFIEGNSQQVDLAEVKNFMKANPNEITFKKLIELKENPPIKDLDDLKKWVKSATERNRTETITKRNVPKIGDSNQTTNLTLLINRYTYTDNSTEFVNIQKLDYLINIKFTDFTVFQLNKKLIELSENFQRTTPNSKVTFIQNKQRSAIPKEFITQDEEVLTDNQEILNYVNQFFPMKKIKVSN